MDNTVGSQPRRGVDDSGHKVGPDVVADLLREQGFSLQGNVKTLEGAQSPDRDDQFN